MKPKVFLYFAISITNLLFSQNIAQDINSFGFALSKSLIENNDANALYSPFSLFTSFSMVASGAEGTTKEAMEAGLKWSQSRQDIANNLYALSNKLSTSIEDPCQLKLKNANAIFIKQDTTFLPGFKALVEDDYQGKVQALDFSKSIQASHIINTLISNETEQKIRNLLQPGDIDSSTRLVLINALYFQGTWQNRFDKKSTQKKSFALKSKTSVSVSMMQQVNPFRYFEDENVQIAILPLCSSAKIKPSLMIILPKTLGTLSEISEKMSTQVLQNYLTSSNLQRLDLQLPAFCLRKRYDLQNTLSSLGMGIAFVDEANFSGIDGRKDLYLSKALHEAYFDLNEDGIEAAASTAASMNVRATAPFKERPISFIANQPFLFFLIEEESQTILFAGKFSDPKTLCR